MTLAPHRRLAPLLAGLLTVASAGAHVVVAATAMDDAYTINEDDQLHVPDVALDFKNLLDNDADGGGTLCVATYDATGLVGTIDATDIQAGSFLYTPPPDWNGETTFTYNLGTSNGQECTIEPDAIATVTITVLPVNDAPTAAGDSFTALRDRTLNVAAPGVLGNDSDVDGDTLVAQKVNSPAHGALTLASDGGFSYTPANGYVGPDAFSYRASDGQMTSPTRLVSLMVSAVPPAPTPAPLPTPTPAPPTSSPEPSPSASPLPTDSGLASPSASAAASGLPSASPEPSPGAGPVSSQGGPPLIAIGALVLLVGLLATAAVYFVRSQRVAEADNEEFEAVEPEDDHVG